MQYKNNYLIQKIDESIEGVLLDTATPVSLLLQYVPSCKAICIDFYYYSFVADEPYLNQLFEGLQNQLEIFYLKNARIKKLPKSLWAAPLKQIHLNLQHSLHIKIELPYLFDNQLESINIKGCEQEIPSTLFHSKQLKKVILSGVSTGYDGLLEAENLETLMLHDYPKTTLEISLQGFKKLKHFELNRCDLEMLPDLSACTQLETLILTDLSRLQNLEINWNALQNLQRLELSHLNFLKHTTLLFNELPILKTLYIGNSNLFLTKNSLGKMPALQAVALRKLSLKYFPKRLLQSNTLLRLFIQDCTYLEAFAFSIASYPLLTTLGILNCPKIVLSNKILIHPNLTKLNYDFQHFKKADFAKTYFKSHLMSLITHLSRAERLDLGFFFLEGKINHAGNTVFKTIFLKLLHHKKESVRRMVFENFHLLQPPSEKQTQFKHYEGKSIAFLKEPTFEQEMYIERLVALNLDYHAVMQVHTDWIVVCAAQTLPNVFWQHPHFFLTERDISQFLMEAQPTDFEISATKMVDALRQLLGSNEQANDLLALEIIDSNGMPEKLFPDLIMIAHLYEYQPIKYRLKKMLEAQLPPHLYKAFVQPFNMLHKNPFKVYEPFAPDFDVTQMVYCYFKRVKPYRIMVRGDLLHRFFQLPMGLYHPLRAEMFDRRFKKESDFFNKDDLHLAGYLLKTDEINFLLKNCRFLKSLRALSVHCVEVELPKIWEIARFERLRIRCHLPDMSNYLAHLPHLEMLYIWNDELKTFPISVLNMHHLKRLRIYTKTPLELPPHFEAFFSRLRVVEILPKPIVGLRI